MKNFLDKDFLLSTETAKVLFHDFAKDLPIIDYHCHIDPTAIADNTSYDTITQLWLGGDHYKWRQMRTNGTDEEKITGSASDLEKFTCWAATLNKLIGNPLYHWSYLELKNYFDFTDAVSKRNAKEVFDYCNKQLEKPEMTVQSIIKRSNVEVICTTDDPLDSLEAHRQIKEDTSFETQVLPTFRPDKALNIELAGFKDYITKLGQVTEIHIDSLEKLLQALSLRLDHFGAHGCRLSDHALTYCFYRPASAKESDAIFLKGLQGQSLTCEEIEKFKTTLLVFLGTEYAKRDWAMQIHFGCLRDNNKRLFESLGPDTGFDAIYTDSRPTALAGLLNALDEEQSLPRTILYSLNPNDNQAIQTLIGCFQNNDMPGKIQHGSAWWFNDTLNGMKEQLSSLAELGMLANFVGMLTDSRSFLSYARHEYFRRIVCELIGGWAEEGLIHNDMDLLSQITQDICYFNAKKYFNL